MIGTSVIKELKIIFQHISVALGASTIMSEHEHTIFTTDAYIIGQLLKLNLLLNRKKKYVTITVVVAKRKVSVDSL